MNNYLNDEIQNIIKDQEDEQSVSQNTPVKTVKPLSHKEQINLTKKGEIVEIELPSMNKNEVNQWQRIIDDFKIRLGKIDTSWQLGTNAQINSNDRLLDTRQLNELKTILEQIGLNLNLIVTRRRQTAVAAASAGYSVQQESSLIKLKEEKQDNQSLAEPLYLKNTIRSGVEICHPSTVIVIGDVNPGANIVAGGDILVWGSLKGIAHAGALNHHRGIIMALRMTPTQLRIGDLVARAADDLPLDHPAEVAYVGLEGINISKAISFYRNYSFSLQKNCWI